jgi:hypothetical protein
MKAAARMEDRGLPIDLPLFEATRKHWKTLRRRIVKRHSAASLYDRDTFKQERFRRLVMSRGWVWPTTETGAFRLDDRTFRAMGIIYPEVNSIRELRSTLADLRTTTFFLCSCSTSMTKATRPSPGIRTPVTLRSEVEARSLPSSNHPAQKSRKTGGSA